MILTDFAEGDQPPALPAMRTLERFLTAATAAVPLRGLVSVLITSDRGIRRLNRQFRQKNTATDVLSFPAAMVPGSRRRGTTQVAGDLAISVDMAARQALALGHPLLAELKVLMLHGLLHLAGFDHEADKGEMAFRELELRRKLRLPGGLIERSTVAAGAVKSKIARGRKAVTQATSEAAKKSIKKAAKKAAKKGVVKTGRKRVVQP